MCICACTGVCLCEGNRSEVRSLRNGFRYVTASGLEIYMPFEVPSMANRMETKLPKSSNSLLSHFQTTFPHTPVVPCHSSQGRSPAISLPCVAFSTQAVLPQASPISSDPNPSKNHLKHRFQVTSRSPLGRMLFPSELTWSLHSLLFWIQGTAFESQSLKQSKQILGTYFQMTEQIFKQLCPSFLDTWSKISVSVLLLSVALTAREN